MIKKSTEIVRALQGNPVDGVEVLDAYTVPGRQQLSSTVCRHSGVLSLTFSTPRNQAAVVLTLADAVALVEAAKKFASLTN
jgi:hypothetical protein